MRVRERGFVSSPSCGFPSFFAFSCFLFVVDFFVCLLLVLRSFFKKFSFLFALFLIVYFAFHVCFFVKENINTLLDFVSNCQKRERETEN